MSEEKQRSLLMAKAKISEKAQRYEDMLIVVKQIIKQNSKLNKKELDLLATAFKYSVANHRLADKAYDHLLIVHQNNAQQFQYVKERKQIGKNETINKSNEIIDLLDILIEKPTEIDENRVFYYKTKGDFLRYKLEVHDRKTEKQVYQKLANSAQSTYKEAQKLAKSITNFINNSIHLGLLLNFSVFYYEVKINLEQAIKISDDAIKKYQSISNQNDATIKIILLLKQNSNSWKQQLQKENESQQKRKI